MTAGADSSRSMKCKRCRSKAEIKLRQHNAAFCRTCFVFFVQRQVRRTIEQHEMIGDADRILVAVSGGKDSLALWDILGELGFNATGVHLSLGIGEYSAQSAMQTRRFAEARNLDLIEVDLAREGSAIPILAGFTNRPACAACGLTKRHFMDKVAADRGFTVLATGHNLDDEAARLLGNVLRWQTARLAKQHPVLPATHARFARKIRPLYRLSEYEMAAYAFFRGIDYVLDECPNSVGATQLVYKDALNRIESALPGAKMSFVREFLANAQPSFTSPMNAPPGSCRTCGAPAFSESCSFCSLKREVAAKQQRRAAAQQRDIAETDDGN